jgi:hypothetical protein
VPGVKELINTIEGRVIDATPPDWDLAAVATREIQRSGSRERLNTIIRTLYADPLPELPPFYELLRNIPPQLRVFATTNYDPYLRRALSARDPLLVVREAGLEHATEDRTVIYQVHGSADDPEHCVISEGNYTSWEDNTALLRDVIVGDLFTRRTVVMVGYRSRDHHFRRMFATIARRLAAAGGNPPPLYFVLPDANPADFALFDELGINVILISTTGDQFLAHLSTAMERELNRRAVSELERILDPPEVEEARAQVHALSVAGQLTPLRNAELSSDLAQRMLAVGQPTIAVRELRNASRLYREAGEADCALQVLAEATEIRLDLLRDFGHAPPHRQTELTDELLAAASPETRVRVLAVTGRAAAAASDPHLAGWALAQLESIEAAGYQLPYQADQHRIRAGIAVLNGQYLRAAEHLEVFVRSAATDGPNTNIERVRALFLRGIGSDPVAARTALQSLAVGVEAEPYRLRALGWLLSLAGDVGGAAEEFRAAARAALVSRSVHAAVSALRAAFWADQRGPNLILRQDPDTSRAWRFERAARNREPFLVTPQQLLDHAAEDLAFDRLRNALVHAVHARTLALTEIDPVGVERSRRVLANLYLRVLETSARQEDILHAAHHLAAVGATGYGSPERDPVERFAEQVKKVANLATVHTLVVNLTQPTLDPVFRAGALRLLVEVAQLTPDDLLPDIVRAVHAGLQQHWAVSKAVNAGGPACELVTTIAERISRADATSLREPLLALAERVPVAARDQVYKALAGVLDQADLPPDGGTEIAEILSGRVNEAQGTHYQDDVLAAVVSLASQTEGAVRQRILDVIRASGAPEPFIETCLVAAGEPVVPAVADRTVERMITSLQRSIAEADAGNSWTFGGIGPFFASQQIAIHATPELRRSAITLAVRFIQHVGHMRELRRAYIPPLAYLAASEEVPPEEVLTLLAEVSKSGLQSGPGWPEERDHPLAAFRLRGSTVTDDRVLALSALAYVYGNVPAHGRAAIANTMTSALRDPDSAVRAGAARQIGSMLNEEPAGSKLRDRLSEHLAASLVDGATEVQAAAIESVLECAESFPPVAEEAIRNRLIEMTASPRTPLLVSAAADRAVRRLQGAGDGR